MRKRRATALAAALVLTGALTACGNSVQTADSERCSQIYSEQEMSEVIELINERCEKNDVKVNYVEYMGDVLSDKADFNEKRGEKYIPDDYDEYMGFKVDVSAPSNRLRDIVSDSEPMSYTEHSDNWWFAREKGGEWELVYTYKT